MASTKQSQNKLNLTFDFDKSTKNTHRFSEREQNGQGTVMGTLYVQKSAFPNGTVPETLQVTVTAK